MEPVDYRVINRRLVESLARSIDLPIGVEVSTDSELGVSKILTGKVKKSRRGQALKSDDPRLIPPLVEALRESGQLQVIRPATANEFWMSDHNGWYVWEETTATPVTLPLKENLPSGVTGPDALNVWVSDPPHVDGPRERWDFSGSFLFLVEELGEFEWPGGWFLSGISSLRMLAEVVARKDPPPMGEVRAMTAIEDVLGRDNSDHPIVKLQSIGGVPGRRRKITTVYKVSYMTDEQAFEVDGEERRVSDILAYPLFIAE
jgi:hypothetical protein